MLTAEFGYINNDGSINLVSLYTYTYDGAGNRVTAVCLVSDQDFLGLHVINTYDDAGNRLTSEAEINVGRGPEDVVVTDGVIDVRCSFDPPLPPVVGQEGCGRRAYRDIDTATCQNLTDWYELLSGE